jgi:universal stress protein A
MSRIKRMLVPTDFSPTSDIAFSYALDLASREGSALHLVHVVDDAMFAAAYPDGFYTELPGVRTQVIGEARARLAELEARCRIAAVPVTSEVVVGRPAPGIAEEAKARGTDLIVMGTHGRSGFAHLMLGSVAERVLRMAPCPVLTVRDTSRAADLIAEEALARRQAELAV